MEYRFSRETTGFTQDNMPNTQAVFSETRNIDLSENSLKRAKRMTGFYVVNSSGSVFDRVSSIEKGLNSSGYPLYYYGTSDQLHYGTVSLDFVARENTSGFGAGTINGGVYCKWWDGFMWTAQGTTLSRLTFATGTWTSGINSLTNDTNHPMCISPGNALCIADRNLIAQRTTAGVFTSNKLTLPNFYEITFLVSDNVRIYIGTKSRIGDKAKVFIWDGASSAYTSEHIVDCPSTVGGIIKDGTLYILTENGALQKFNGLGFDTVAGFKYTFDNDSLIGNSTYTIGSPQCLALSDKGIYVSLNNQAYDGVYPENVIARKGAHYGGVYEYIEGIGLFHKYAISFTTDPTNPEDFGHFFDTPIHATERIQKGSNGGWTYYNGYSNITASYGNGADLITTGQTQSTTTVAQHYVACAATTGRNISHAVTKKIYPSAQTESFVKVIVKYRNLFSASSSIKIKYRVKQYNLLPFCPTSMNWTATSIFTTTDPRFAYAQIGDEITLVQGKNSGKMSKISAISEASGTYTVTIADTIRDATTITSQIGFIDRWVGIPNGTLTGSANNNGVWELPIPSANQGSFIELKFILDGDEDITIDEFVLITTNDKKY